MKPYSFVIIFLAVVCFSYAQAQEEKDPFHIMSQKALDKLDKVEAVSFERTNHPNAQWFPEAGFGLFMHWGIHSVAGIQPSWSMIKDYPYGTDKTEYHGEGYYTLLEKFNPQNYDPDKWIEAAAKAGMTYAVITVKHHDGYALWPSEFGKMSTKQYMDGRDLIRPYIDACRKYGLKVGLYFSPRDWGYSGYPVSLEHKVPYIHPPGIDNTRNQRNFNRFYNYTVGQLSEILTRWGKIDLLWFDGMGWLGINDIRTEETLAWVRLLQPHIVINNRWGGEGDYITPEWQLPVKAPEGWWENCISWSGHWGYSPDTPVEPNSWVMKKLVEVRSWGGNFLLNIGPAPDGTMRPEYYERTDELARWMAHSRESLIGAEPVKEWKKFSNVPITQRENLWYVHVLPDHDGEITILDVPKPSKVQLLRTKTPLTFSCEGRKITLTLPDTLRTDLNDVIEIHW